MIRRRTTCLLSLLAAAGLTACGGSPAPDGSSAAPPPASSAPATTPATAPATASPEPGSPDLSDPQVLVTGLEVPWGLGFLPGGDALVTERETARVLRVPAQGGEPTEVTRIEAAAPRGEGGLLGLAVSPTFSEDQLVYVYVTTERDNRVLRFPLDRPQDVEPVLTGIPAGAIHNGGRVAFGPDGLLWVTTGDAGDTSLAQDPDSLGGKVLRMTPEGEPPPGQSSLVYSLGHRNVQGIAFGPQGQVYTVEFGQNRFDEINAVELGSNGGWPEVEGPGDGGGRFLAPITTWDPAEASPSGGAIVGDTLYVAALRGQRLWQVPLDDPDDPTAALEGELGRLRTVAQAPDGSLWVLTSNRDGRGDPTRQDDRIVRFPVR